MSVCQDAAFNISVSSAYLLMTTKKLFIFKLLPGAKKLTAQHTEQHTQHTLNPLLEAEAQLRARLSSASE